MTEDYPSPTFSVILPAHNAERTLERAIKSVAAQTRNDLELLIVDDFSSDQTGAIARRVAAEASNIHIVVISQPTNQGVSAARNAGLRRARGAYVSFLDSDDEYLPDYLAMLETNMNDGVDVVVCGREVVRPDGSMTTMRSSAVGVFSGEEAVRLAMTDKLTPFPWDKLFRRSLFTGLGFPEGAARFEDMVTNILLYSKSERVKSIDAPLCRYYIAVQSLTWGRVPSLNDTSAALEYLDQHLPVHLGADGNRRSYTSMQTLITLLIAQSSLSAKDFGREAQATVADCRTEITIGAALTTVRGNPGAGLAAMLLKTSPRIFARLYRWHINRSYGVAL